MKNNDVKVEWCEDFIKVAFKKHVPEGGGIYARCFWDMAERSGLWERGTYGTPMSKALEKLTTVEAVKDTGGNFVYHIFRLREFPAVTPLGERREDMYNVKDMRSLRKVVRKMKQGEKLYVNAISLTVNAIGQLREYIKEKVLLPDKTEAEQIYNDIPAIMCGKTILPQMTYIRQ